MTNDLLLAIIGYVLFGVSELLPLINISANGILHSFVVGFANAFKSMGKDMELAQRILQSKPDFVGIVNTIATNPSIKNIMDNVIQDPQFASNISKVQNSSNLYNQVNVLTANAQVQKVVDQISKDSLLCKNVVNLVSNRELYDVVRVISTSDHLIDALSNTAVLQNLTNYPDILSNLQYINPLISSNVTLLINNPHLSTTVSNLENNQDSSRILSVVDKMISKPTLIDDIESQIYDANVKMNRFR